MYRNERESVFENAILAILTISIWNGGLRLTILNV